MVAVRKTLGTGQGHSVPRGKHGMYPESSCGKRMVGCRGSLGGSRERRIMSKGPRVSNAQLLRKLMGSARLETRSLGRRDRRKDRQGTSRDTSLRVLWTSSPGQRRYAIVAKHLNTLIFESFFNIEKDIEDKSSRTRCHEPVIPVNSKR